MKKTQKLAAVMTAVLLGGALGSSTLYAADNAFRIDEINWTQEDWACIAMTNDDTVETGAVIRTEANADSEAAGYLYRGAGAKVISKGEEWTLIESGKVTGYVKNEFLMFGDEARGLAAHYGKKGVEARWNDVSVFSDNSADASVSKTLNDGAVLGMVQDSGHWITVQKDKDSAGYVSEEDVSRVLLVDTAVPAQGEDMEDVPVTLTASDVPAGSGANDSGQAEYAAAEAAPEETWEDAGVEYADYSEVQDNNGEVYTAEHVSDDPVIQALYEAFIEAQNAAMNCTSEEDAQAKAAAATAAWNAYLAACNGTYVSASEDTASDDGSSDDELWEEADEYEDEEDDWYEDDEEDEDWYEEDEEDDWYEADDEEEEDTSAAAAAAQSTNSGSYAGYSDLDLLAAIIWCEAGNQPYDGMVAVGQVVMNRVKSGSFPNTIAEVLNQPGQFTPASAGTLQASLAAGINATCYAAASDALNGSAPVPGTPLYFNTHSGSYKLGAHYFS